MHEIQVVFGNPFIRHEVDRDLHPLLAERPVNPPTVNGLHLTIVDEHALRPTGRVEQRLEDVIHVRRGIRLQPNAPKHLGGSNRTIIKQSFEMLVSDRTRLADQPVGAMVSIDKIYELVEGNTPSEKQKDILDIRQRFDDDKDNPGMAARVAKAICLMEFAKTDLPRTTKNIAALLVQQVTEAPPALAVAAILDRLKEAQFVRETEDGWKLQTAQEKGWDQEKRGYAAPNRNDRAEILRNAVKGVFVAGTGIRIWSLGTARMAVS
jgi:hypothetical protein